MYRIHTSPCPRKTTINDLPPEVLMKIFKTVHADTQATDDANFYQQQSFTKSANLNIFPYTLAAVSPFWKNVLSSFPSFWTKVIITIDSADSESDIWSLLSWSRHFLIDVLVTLQTPRAFEGWPDLEHTRVRQAITAITPHVPRCKTLVYDVTYTSSLPRLATDFPDVAPHLTKLCLNAAKPGVSHAFFDGCIPVQYPFPILSNLIVDGWNFVEICKTAIWWFYSFCTTRHGAHIIAISHYQHIPGEKTGIHIHIDDISRLFEPFVFIALHNVSFDATAPDDLQGLTTRRGGKLTLSSLSGGLAATMIRRHFQTSDLIIHSCPLSRITQLPTADLTLTGIDYSGFAEDLLCLLPLWEGLTLNVRNCPNFDDRHLGVIERTPQGMNQFCPGLSVLRLSDCRGFTIPALRRMVEARLSRGLFSIALKNGPKLTAEESQWYQGIQHPVTNVGSPS